MNGIPLQIRRDGQFETVYLSTRRSGEVGRKMLARKREYRVALRKSAHRLQDRNARDEHLQQVLMTYGLILVFEELRSLVVGDDVHGVSPPVWLAGSIP